MAAIIEHSAGVLRDDAAILVVEAANPAASRHWVVEADTAIQSFEFDQI